MGVFLVRRILTLLISLLVIASLSFVLLLILPGGPFDGDAFLHTDVYRSLEKQAGLNRGWGWQYLDFLTRLLRFDLGNSLSRPSLSFSKWFFQGLPSTLVIGSWSFGLVIFGALFISICGQLFPRARKVVVGINKILISLPLLLLGPLLLYFFSYQLSIFPLIFNEEPISYVLPILVLSARPIGKLSQMLHDNLDQVMKMDFIRTAQSIGVSHFKQILIHAFPYAALPVLGHVGIVIAQLLSGSLIVETLFSAPGLGKAYIEAIFARDYFFVVGLTIYFSIILGVANLILDFLIQWVDPRVKSL